MLISAHDFYVMFTGRRVMANTGWQKREPANDPPDDSSRLGGFYEKFSVFHCDPVWGLNELQI